ncbi:oxidoreductase [Paenibacillus sp. TY11]|uniref:oxidoreductase n=1 Tax=Paenibacillus sp. TY11 TaxID=3448633 RepID=UPI00403A2218
MLKKKKRGRYTGVAVNKIIYPHVAESILKEGKADFVAMGRASTADPQFPNKVKEGRLDEIIFCIGCRQGCQWRIAQQDLFPVW